MRITVGELLSGKRLDVPPIGRQLNQAFKRAPEAPKPGDELKTLELPLGGSTATGAAASIAAEPAPKYRRKKR